MGSQLQACAGLLGEFWVASIVTIYRTRTFKASMRSSEGAWKERTLHLSFDIEA